MIIRPRKNGLGGASIEVKGCKFKGLNVGNAGES